MHYELFTLALMAIFFFGMWGSALVGHRYGRRRVETVGGSAAEGTGVVEAAMFALLGLLIAFTFATAYSRFNTRRDLVVQEANAIGTAYLRLDLLPAEAQSDLREKFRAYVDSRLTIWRDNAAERHPGAAPDTHLPHAVRAGDVVRLAHRLRHGIGEEGELAPYCGLCGDGHADRLRDP
jgi:hypothetical protein